MTIHANDLRPPEGATRTRKRIGRGHGSGQGTYAGRGLKGQKSRSGKKQPYPGFEGGAIPFYRKLPHLRGFTNRFRVEYQPINLERLARFEDGATVTPETMHASGLVGSKRSLIKILGRGDIDRALHVEAHAFSASAYQKITAAGGTATVVGANAEEVADPAANAAPEDSDA